MYFRNQDEYRDGQRSVIVVVEKKKNEKKKVESSEGHDRGWYGFYEMVVR